MLSYTCNSGYGTRDELVTECVNGFSWTLDANPPNCRRRKNYTNFKKVLKRYESEKVADQWIQRHQKKLFGPYRCNSN